MKNFNKKTVTTFLLVTNKRANRTILSILYSLLFFSITGMTQNTSYNSNSIPIVGSNCAAFGYWALSSNTTGSWNTATGYISLYNNTSGHFNTAHGARALFFNVTGINNTANGYSALYTSTGNNNTATGFNTLYSNTTGSQNTADGAGALYFNTTGSFNTANGMNTLLNNTIGSFNTAYGMNALRSNTTGADNNASGHRSLVFNSTGSFNTACGNYALLANTIGNNNTALGYFANVSAGALTNATAIGSGAIVNANNKIRLGNAAVTVVEGPVIYTVSDARFKSNVSEKDVKGLEFIKRLRPVVYNFDARKLTEFLTVNMPDSTRNKYTSAEFAPTTAIRQSGFIAQEVEEAALATGYNFNGLHKPDNENDNYSLAYGQFVVPLVKGMQEQQQLIEKQQQQLEKQQQQIDELKKIIDGQSTVPALNKATSDAINIFPNPGSGLFTITTKGISADRIEIYNLEGRRIYHTALTNNAVDYKLDLSGYPNGIYLVTISSKGKEITSRKLIIE